MLSEPKICDPIYNIQATYAENVQMGPSFNGEFPVRKWRDEKDWIDFLGYKIASPLGVPAGPLLTSAWTTLAAKLGFDVVTYKTIRSQAYAGHPLPNVIFVEPENQQIARPLTRDVADPSDLSITNSFGMPSMPPSFLQTDIAKARHSLSKGQLLIVSIVGTPAFSENLVDDFVKTAQLAKDAGAHAIEANFSCPNVSSKEGCLYFDADNSYKIAAAIAKAIAPLPLLIKVGKYSDKEAMRKVVVALARAGVRGVCGINSLSMRVVDAHGAPALGYGRETSGICGEMIRPTALQFVKDARSIIDKEHLDLELVGCGGITAPEHFDAFLQAGAKVATTATGMMWNPFLAAQWHNMRAYA